MAPATATATAVRATRPDPKPKARDSGAYGAEDYANSDKDALSVEQLEKWLQEIREQPNWRLECDKDADYYDGHQLPPDVLEKMRLKGFPTIIENLTRPTIDAVLGLEAKSRTDWVVRHDHDRWEEVALAMSSKLKEAEREAGADRACSDGFAAQIKAGLGWVEVSREIVPTRYPYRVQYVHRREIAWDWREEHPERWRYLVRRKWFDKDVLIAMFPKQRKVIEKCLNGWSGWWDDVIRTNDTGLAASYEVERATTIEQMEFRDYLRERLCLYEVWYRVWKSLPMLKLPDGRWVEYDRKNREHVAAVGTGILKPEVRPVPKVRLAFFIGPHRMVDIPSPYAHDQFPYIPLFGYREDRSGAPYGLIRGMRPQQDEVNARKAKMMWLLSAKRVRADADAVADHEVAKDEVARPDAYIILNQNRKPASKFEVDDQLDLSEQQFKIYESAKQSLQDVAGVYQALLGKESAAESGIAINTLIEQGTTTLAEIMDNYRYGRRKVGELLMALVREDIANGETVMVGEGTQRREVTLNEAANDEFGPHLKNDVRRAGVKVVLDDIPSTPTFRAQQFTMLAEFVKGLPDDIKAIVSDFVVEATDLPMRKAVAERIRQHLGIQSQRPPRNAEEKAQQEEQERKRKKGDELKERGAEAEVRQLEADVAKTEVETANAMREGQEQQQEEVARQVEEQVGKIVEQAQAMIEMLNEEIARLTEELSGQTDAELRAAVEIAKANLEAMKKEELQGMKNAVADAQRKMKDAQAAAKKAEKPQTKKKEGATA